MSKYTYEEGLLAVVMSKSWQLSDRMSVVYVVKYESVDLKPWVRFRSE